MLEHKSLEWLEMKSDRQARAFSPYFSDISLLPPIKAGDAPCGIGSHPPLPVLSLEDSYAKEFWTLPEAIKRHWRVALPPK